jgi:hypothetical protein
MAPICSCWRFRWISLAVVATAAVVGAANWAIAAGDDAQNDVSQLAGTLKSVGAEAQGSVAATEAWRKLSQLPAEQMPTILLQFDGASPLAANYLRSAVGAIAEKRLQEGGELPVDRLEALALDRAKDGRARRLAYRWLCEVDSTASDRIIPGMLDDPDLDFRREAVARLLAAAESEAKAGDKESAIATYSKALDAARSIEQVQTCSEQLEKLGKKVDVARHFGFLAKWKIVAPFDNVGGGGFQVAYEPEKKIDLSAKYQGKDDKIGWIDYTTDDPHGEVDLNKVLERHKGAVAYAVTEFVADKPMTVDVRLGSINAVKLWVNGKLLFDREVYHASMAIDQYIAQAEMQKGRNEILVKICQNEQTETWAQRWAYQLRICDEQGKAILSADR